jgi:hypothetical protein
MLCGITSAPTTPTAVLSCDALHVGKSVDTALFAWSEVCNALLKLAHAMLSKHAATAPAPCARARAAQAQARYTPRGAPGYARLQPRALGSSSSSSSSTQQALDYTVYKASPAKPARAREARLGGAAQCGRSVDARAAVNDTERHGHRCDEHTEEGLKLARAEALEQQQQERVRACTRADCVVCGAKRMTRSND